MGLSRLTSASLSAKLLLTIGLLIILGGCISWYLLIRAEKQTLTENAVKHLSFHSQLIKKATRYGMLTFHREAIQQTINDMSVAENIIGIRLFDSKGKIFYSSKIDELGRMVDRTSLACIGCHSDPQRPSITLTSKDQWTIYASKEGHRILTYIEPIYNEPSCYTATCHAHPPEQRVLGILETDFSLAHVDRVISQRIVAVTSYAIIFSIATFFVFYITVRALVLRPVSVLSSAMRKASGGDLSEPIPVRSQDEMGLLASTFNLMIKELETARQRMSRWTEDLEREVTKKTQELRDSQEKLIQAEKLASLGRLTADVAHEIRNPLTSIGGFAKRLSRIASTEKEKEYADTIRCEVSRLENILRDLIAFSREARFHLERHEVEGFMKETMLIFEDLCKDQNISVEIKVMEGTPQVLIDKEQVRRALANLITNAIDAMPEGGFLTLSAGLEVINNADFIFIKVSDTGVGIPEERLPFIFEPFYSTKEIGRGTGLGLSIARKVMEEHCGFIRAESTPGKGSTFILYFPYQPDAEYAKIQCWEFMKCGRDKDATVKCPAYPHFGRICWVVAGTFCEGKIQGTFAQKFEDCRKCDFYQKRTNKEI